MLTRRSRIALGGAVALVLMSCGGIGPAWAQAPPRRPSPEQQYEPITKGLVGNPLLPVQFRSAPLRLEVRNLIIGRVESQDIPTPARAILELRSGAVVTTINGEKRERRSGDFWEVEKGSRFALENLGDVAVIRAIYVFEGSR